MRLYSAFRFFSDALHDVARRDRAIGADVVWLGRRHLPEHRPSDLHRVVKIFCLHAPRAVVAGAALDHRHLRARHHLQRLARFLPHVLHACMAGDVIGDLAERVLEVGAQEPIALAQHEVLERIEHRVAYRDRIRIVRIHERQLLLEHERARRYRCQDGEALARVTREDRQVLLLQRIDALEVAELELGHAAAGLLLDQHVGNLVVLEQRHQVVAHHRLVVVHIAGGGEQAVAELDALFEFDSFRPEHHMRKVDVPRVRRNVGALRHVAEVAEVALVDDLPVVLLRHAVDLHRLGVVDEVEQRGKGGAQIYAAAATVANLEDAPELGLGLEPVPELGRLPGERVPGRRLERAFSHESDSWSNDFWKRLAWLRSALARVSNQSAISPKPSSRADFAMPGYMSVYSWVSPATAAFRFSCVRRIGRLVAGSPTVSRYSRWPCACPVSPSAVERKRAETSLWPSTSAFAAK